MQFLIMLFLCGLITIAKTTVIHVFGDSHARLSFCSEDCPEDVFIYPLTEKNGIIPHQFVIHWLGPVTMHRVGRDGLGGLDIRNYGVKEGEIAIFSYGEIDTRAHIIKQRDLYGRELTEIVDTLTNLYCDTIVANKKLFKNIICIVSSVIPPVRGHYRDDSEQVIYGSLTDRTLVNGLLNKRLKEMCEKKNIGFALLYESFYNADGSLNECMTRDFLHVAGKYTYLVKNALLDYLKSKYYDI